MKKPKKPNGFIENPNKPNGFSENPEKPNGYFENPPQPKKPDIDKEVDVDKDIDIDNDFDKDIDSDSENEKEKKKKEEEKMNDEEKMKSKNKKTNIEYICEKLDEILGPTSDKIKNECCDYLRFLSLEVILYAIVITEKARIPCWNYTKRVLEDYKSKKIRTFNQLLVYLDKTEKSKNNNYTNRTHYSFMDDMHSKEEWEALYDN